MSKIIFGKNEQIVFNGEEEKYFSIGFLCNSSNATITIEDNATRGSYTDAWRIRVKNTESLCDGLNNALRDSNRINCNEFIQYLICVHRFECDDNVHITADYDDVIETIPDEYKSYFIEGYNS